MDASATATPQTKKPITSEQRLHSESALAIGAKLNEFVITGIIGEGGFGIVYSAKDTLLQRNVAIKEYMPAAIASRLASSKINLRSVRHQQTFVAGMQGFIDEARLLAQFKHPALVEIFLFWEANGTAYMVMPHYSGKTLRNILKTSRNVCSERWLKSILGPVLDAIELLHSSHVYHRDIAPDNIVIQDNGQPVLLDLGSARRVIAGMQSALTVVVKPGYAPIEQYTEDTANEQGPWTDIYALGAVLYFAISGSAPIASVSRMMRDSLKPLNTDDHPHYSDSFLASINKALQIRPCDRFQSIADFRNALNINTSLAGNISLDSATREEATTQEPQIVDKYKDEEITLILSEDEISIFKEKLLQSLHSSTAPMQQQFNENILSNASPTKNDQYISSFADVKDLLADKNYAAKHKNTKRNKDEAKVERAAEYSYQDKLTKRKNDSSIVSGSSIKQPMKIGAVVLIGIIVAAVFTVTSNRNDAHPNGKSQNDIMEATRDSYEIKETGIGDAEQENIIRPSITQEVVESNTVNSDQFRAADAENIFSIAPSTSIIDHQEPKVAIETTNSTLTEQTDVLSEPLSPQANPPASEAQNSFTADKAQEQNNDAKKSAGKIATQAIKGVEIDTEITEMGSAKLTLVPWGEIWVDNQRFGVSPPLREIVLATGTYTIELRNPGLPTETRTLTFGKGENAAIYHNFSAAKPTTDVYGNNNNSSKKENSKEAQKSNIKQDTNNNDAKEQTKPVIEPVPKAKPSITRERTLSFKILPWGEIFLNGKMVGVTPPLHDLKLVPGEHTIEIRHPSYPSKTIQITADDPTTENIEHNFQ